MASLTTYILTIHLVGIDGRPATNVSITVSVACPDGLIYPVGPQSETFIPTTKQIVTDAQGAAEIDLLPSKIVGKYRIEIGATERKITMPESDALLSEL